MQIGARRRANAAARPGTSRRPAPPRVTCCGAGGGPYTSLGAGTRSGAERLGPPSQTARARAGVARRVWGVGWKRNPALKPKGQKKLEPFCVAYHVPGAGPRGTLITSAPLSRLSDTIPVGAAQRPEEEEEEALAL